MTKIISVLKINYGKDLSELFIKLIKDKQHLRNSLIILSDKLRDTEFRYFPYDFIKMRKIMSELIKKEEVLIYSDFYETVKQKGLTGFLDSIKSFYEKYSNKIFVDIVKELNVNLNNVISSYHSSGRISKIKTRKLSKVNSGSINLNSNIVRYKNSKIITQIFTRDMVKRNNLPNIEFYVNLENLLNMDKATIKNVNVVVKRNRDVFLHLTYEEDIPINKGDRPFSLGIDPGLVNHLTISSDNPKSRPLLIRNRAINNRVSINRYQMNRLNSSIDKLFNKRQFGKEYNNLKRIREHLNDTLDSTVNNEINKITSRLIDYCNTFNIGKIYFGRNIGMKVGNKKKGKRFNKKLNSFPHYKLLLNLKYKCSIYGIEFIEQEESYTSKFSCLNKGSEIWKYNYKNNRPTDTVIKEQGVRGKRGLYKDRTTGLIINSDVNGAFNIINKGKGFICDVNKSQVTRPLKIKDDFQFLDYLASI